MNLAKLESSLGHKFQTPELLMRALTHRSWAHENLKGESDEKVRESENESFEFIGDSVLGLAIAEQLYAKHPGVGEGDLTLMKHRLVSMATLAGIAETLQLGQYLRMGRGEHTSGGRAKPAILADTLEAIIGAIFFDSGYIAARVFVARIFADELKSVTPKSSVDYKTLLQETLQAQKLAAPVYTLVSTEGQPHDRTFYVEAAWANGKATGTGRSIKTAEMMAASNALKAIAAKWSETESGTLT
jgi:ribonuclease III